MSAARSVWDRAPLWTLTAAFLSTRVALWAVGLSFQLDLRWMFLADPAELRDHLGRTLVYFHAFPPGMNLLTGLLLQGGDAGLRLGAVATFWGFGLLLTLSLYRLLARLSLPPRLCWVLSLGFSLLPASLFFENLYLYTYPCAALLTCALVAFARARAAGRWLPWAGFFALCAALGAVRTTFHLVWFLAMAAAALGLSPRAQWLAVARGAALPLSLLLSLYLKNYFLFGFFGTTSWSGANLTLATTQRMDAHLRNRWVQQGVLSRYARINVFAPPSQYLEGQPRRQYPWPGSNEPWRRTLRQPNFNHGVFLEVNRTRGKDARTFIARRPTEYARTVLGTNLPSYFSASTHWHPHDARPEAPHAAHRRALGGYERTFDALVHRWPVPGVGLYCLLPIVLAWGAWVSVRRAARDLRGHFDGAEADSRRLVLLCLLQVVFVSLVSVLLTAQESARYRFVVEPCIFALCARGGLELVRVLRSAPWRRLR